MREWGPREGRGEKRGGGGGVPSGRGVNSPLSKDRFLLEEKVPAQSPSISLALAQRVAGIMALKSDISSKVSRNICEQH